MNEMAYRRLLFAAGERLFRLQTMVAAAPEPTEEADRLYPEVIASSLREADIMIEQLRRADPRRVRLSSFFPLIDALLMGTWAAVNQNRRRLGARSVGRPMPADVIALMTVPSHQPQGAPLSPEEHLLSFLLPQPAESDSRPPYRRRVSAEGLRAYVSQNEEGLRRELETRPPGRLPRLSPPLLLELSLEELAESRLEELQRQFIAETRRKT